MTASHQKTLLEKSWFYGFLLIAFVVWECTRKDVDRNGDIKMRGENTLSLDRKREGAHLQRGIASWYGGKFHGRMTSNGETYDMWALTAAHKSLPFGTRVKVVNRDNGKSVVVRINDRGPFIRGRIIDLSRRAAEGIAMVGPGTATVDLYLAETAQAEASIPSPRLAEGFWTIQVGSFAERPRADAMAERMKTYSSRVSMEQQQGMYRVRVGRFPKKEDAFSLAERLYRHHIPVWILFVKKGS